MTPLYHLTGFVLVHLEDQWHGLRAAYVGESIVTTCELTAGYSAVCVRVLRPGETLPRGTCPACQRHLGITPRGASLGVSAEPPPAQRTTRDLKRGRTPTSEWSDGTPEEVAMADLVSRPVRSAR